MGALIFGIEGLAAIWLIAPLMIAIILCDLRFMRIPDAISLLLILIFCASVPFSLPMGAVLWQVLTAVLVLVLGITAFAFRLLGGGDVKALAALVLLIPTKGLAAFALSFSACLILGVVFVQTMRFLITAKSSNWAFLNGEKRFPMGVSIGGAGLVYSVISGPWTLP